MCHPKPGPRCASHLRESIKRTQQQVDENFAAWTNGETLPHKSPEGNLHRLKDEYDETTAGQAELATQIAAADATDPWGAEDLRTRKVLAASRREAKLAALKATQRGDTAAAETYLRYGPHAGFLNHTTLVADSAETGGPIVYRDYAIGQTYYDTHAETAESVVGVREAVVADSTFVYEAPVVPGPTPGTWIVGHDATPPQDIDPKMDATLAATTSLPNQSFRPVRATLYNAETHTVAAYDPTTRTVTGRAHPISDPAALQTLDYNGGVTHTSIDPGASDIGPTTGFRGETEIRATPDGHHILHGTFDFSTT